MKKLLFTLILMMSSLALFAQTPKAVLSSDGTTLTFYYDNESHEGSTYSLNSGMDTPGWASNGNITTVVFDSSFAEARPTMTYCWFLNLTNLENIIGIGYLNTSAVENMSHMFFNCSSLTTLNLSSFNTARVDDMYYMFYGCSSLTSLNLSSFNTAAVKKMSYMFSDCSSLTSLNLSSFNTAAVKDMSHMFLGCGSITSLDLSSFNTAAVEDMEGMFQGCTRLTSLNLSSFNTAAVEDMNSMFQGCSKLKAILVSDNFSTNAVKESVSMFEGCTSIVGGKGTTYDSGHTDATYARIDGGTDSPGYFISKYVNSSKAVLSGTTLTFYYDNESHEGSTYSLNSGTNKPGWQSNRNITTVVFDSSFANAQPTTTYCWFLNLTNLENIIGIEYLNTSAVEYMNSMFQGCTRLTSLNLSSFNTEAVKYMYSMFQGCTSLTSLDLSNFNTEQVNYMDYMFYGCTSLTSLDLSSFNTAAVKKMNSMFYGCSSLTSLNLSSFNTAAVGNMSNMFQGCSSLTTLDLSSFNTAAVENMNYMFKGCSKLKAILVSDNFSTNAVKESASMFEGCTSIVGGKGTKYDGGHTDATYARIDGGTENPGYFIRKDDCSSKTVLSGTTLTFYYDPYTYDNSYALNSGMSNPGWINKTDISTVVFDPSFANALPTTTYCWFKDLTKLTTFVGMNYLNTTKVKNMNSMFSGCTSLTTLDLSSFNTAAVKDMCSMFYNCTNLKTIFAGSGFTLHTSLIRMPSPQTFTGCTNLVGGGGTTYNSNCATSSYARLDIPEYSPGYFSDKSSVLTLSNNASNSTTLTGISGNKIVYLEGRTLYRDGYWNTICLPFYVDLSNTSSPLYGATAMELSGASFSGGTLTLSFKNATALSAGMPYIIKWEDTGNTLPDLIDPEFKGANITNTTPQSVTYNDASDNPLITFKGTYDYQSFTEANNTILFMGASNKLYYPKSGAEIGAFRAYFQLEGDLTAGDNPTSQIRAINLNFDEQSESTSITTILPYTPSVSAWYTLDGRRLLDKPVQPGMYIRDGRKVMMGY